MLNKQKTKNKHKISSKTKKSELKTEVTPLSTVSSRATHNRDKRNKNKQNQRWRNNNVSNPIRNPITTETQFRFLARISCRLAGSMRPQGHTKGTGFFHSAQHTNKRRYFVRIKRRQEKPIPRVSPYNYMDRTQKHSVSDGVTLLEFIIWATPTDRLANQREGRHMERSAFQAKW